MRRGDCETFLLEVMNRTSASTAKTRHTGMSRFFACLDLRQSYRDAVKSGGINADRGSAA